jgi:uncharacterized protein YndB with AHSA1/START domain
LSLAAFSTRRRLVFKAWTYPQHLAHWWGPNSFSITTHAMEFKPGGVWRFVTHGPDGCDYQNKAVYVEITEPERLVYDPVSQPQFRMAMTFTDQGGKTIITTQMHFDSAALRDKTVKEFGAVEGLKQIIEQLGEYVTQEKERRQMNGKTEVITGDHELTITRIFDAPRELVFSAWTKPEYLMRWFAPNGFTLPSCEMDFRVGGKYRLCMRGLGRDHWVSGEYREIVPPRRIVWTGALEHEGNEVVTIVRFADLAGKTRLTVHQRFSIETDSTRGARYGWTETLEHLAEFLKTA